MTLMPGTTSTPSGTVGRLQKITQAGLITASVLGSVLLPSGAAASASGAVTPERFSSTTHVGPDPVDDTCRGPGVEGLLTGTSTVSGQLIETRTGVHFRGTDELVYRVDFPDGSYLIAAQRAPLTFTSNPMHGITTYGGTLLEKGTLYDASGAVLGQEMFHAVFRTTIINGTAVVDFDRGRLSCR